MNPALEEISDDDYDSKILTSSLQSPKRIVLESTKDDKPSKWYGPCKDCYCHKDRISPLLFGAPLNCLDDVKLNETKRRCKIHDDLNTTYLDKNHNVCNHDFLHRAKKIIDYKPKSNFLKNLQQEVKDKCHCLGDGIESEPFKLEYSDDRVNYESNRPPSCYEKDYSRELRKFNASGDCALEREGNNVALPSVLSDGDKSSTFERKDGLDKSIKESNVDSLANFRDKNFFDCVSTSLQKKNVPEHTCLHKFTINDRLYPVPINSDAYGVSRCSICNTRIADNDDDDGNVKMSQNVGIQTKTKNDFYNISKRYRNNLMPKCINMTRKNQKIQVQLPDDDIARELLTLNIRPYTCQPLNSYALRYQKGVMK